MIQRFIELGQGYSDVYELQTLATQMKDRVENIFAFHTTMEGEERTSLAVVMKPTTTGNFQPIYICREGIPNPHVQPNKRYELFQQIAADVKKDIIEITTRPSTFFSETELYYSHLIGLLRMNHYLAPLQ
ncbi:methylthioribose kinase [Pontibacillus salicampi]|uniref:Methylthioribose kinase n=1 Tax=Pontibacillus salicampi TaxID=1449801 RepID=A0ABV6LNN1_9BACI